MAQLGSWWGELREGIWRKSMRLEKEEGRAEGKVKGKREGWGGGDKQTWVNMSFHPIW